MKLPSFLLLLSLVANVLFAVCALRSKESTKALSIRLRETLTSSIREPKADPSIRAANSRTEFTLWDALATEDLHEYMRRLQAAGFPPDAVRALVTLKVDERFEKRRKSILANWRNLPYWRARTSSVLNPTQNA